MVRKKVVSIVLALKSQKFRAGIKKVNAGWARMKSNVLSVKTAIGAVAGAMVLGKMVSVGKDLIGLAEKQYFAEARLAQAMKAKGEYTRSAFDSLKKYASQMQAATIIGDEEYLSAMAMLKAFGLSNDEMKRTIPIIADFAAAGKNAISMAELLGRAYTGETSMLSRYGVSLKQVTAAGGDFNAVLRVMAKLHEGEAAALAKTDYGKLRQAANAWGDLKENVGKGLAEGVMESAKAFGLLAENLSKADQAATLGQKLAKGMGTWSTNVAGIWHSFAAQAYTPESETGKYHREKYKALQRRQETIFERENYREVMRQYDMRAAARAQAAKDKATRAKLRIAEK